jgi:hypothetical protein
MDASDHNEDWEGGEYDYQDSYVFDRLMGISFETFDL